MRGISWLVEDLSSSQEGLCCMELDSLFQIPMLITFANSIIMEGFKQNQTPKSWYRAAFYLKTVYRLPVDTTGGHKPYPKGEEPEASRREEMEDWNISTSKTDGWQSGKQMKKLKGIEKGRQKSKAKKKSHETEEKQEATQFFDFHWRIAAEERHERQ